MLIVQTENKAGSDCTGSSGDSGRTLTLSNTGKTASGGFLVYASGLALSLTTEYSVVHNSTDSVITFVNPLWDDMLIVINYYEQRTTKNDYEIMRDDLQSVITEHGREVTLIRPTETTASMGEVTAVSEEEYTIWTLIQDITRKDRQIHEMGLAVPGNSKAFFYHEYPDSITGNGVISPQTGDMIKDEDDRYWRIEQIVSQHQGDNNEIFRTGIIKNIDLDQ